MGIRDLDARDIPVHPDLSCWISHLQEQDPLRESLTTIFKVSVAATLNPCKSRNTSNAIASMNTSPAYATTQTAPRKQEAFEAGAEDDQKSKEAKLASNGSLSFLNRAVTSKPINRSLECSVQQVEDVKVVLKLLPVFACTIILNCCLAQLSTFSVQQTSTMDTKLGSLEVPPASLPIFPILFIMILAPVYDHFIIPFARLATKTETGITHLQRIDHGGGRPGGDQAEAGSDRLGPPRLPQPAAHHLLLDRAPVPVPQVGRPVHPGGAAGVLLLGGPGQHEVPGNSPLVGLFGHGVLPEHGDCADREHRDGPFRAPALARGRELEWVPSGEVLLANVRAQRAELPELPVLGQ